MSWCSYKNRVQFHRYFPILGCARLSCEVASSWNMKRDFETEGTRVNTSGLARWHQPATWQCITNFLTTLLNNSEFRIARCFECPLTPTMLFINTLPGILIVWSCHITIWTLTLLEGVGRAQSAYWRATCWKSRVRFPAVHHFSLRRSVYRGSGVYPGSYSMDSVGSFPGDKAAGPWSWPLTSI
jgi:hypothetical protein